MTTLREALNKPGCERIKDYYSVGPIQKAAVEQFLDEYMALAIKETVNKFLGWKLPLDFYPDNGISFDKKYVEKWGMPTGTNLLTADQATEMFKHCLSVNAARAALAAEQPQAATADDMKVYEAECRKTCNVCWSGDSDGQWPCAKSKASPQANQPQAGWKLVPIEPTPEMLFAGHMKIDFDRSEQNTYEMSHESQRGPEGVGTTIEQDMRDCWSAMIAAAPEAPWST